MPLRGLTAAGSAYVHSWDGTPFAYLPDQIWRARLPCDAEFGSACELPAL
jgi:hypothetical protein